MGLKEYSRKRNFRATPEPAPRKRAGAPSGNSFVVQKHAASSLHFDFRLELDGVLKSWAVPKGPSFDPKDKRLAVEVEDHPVEYGSFEGTIPEGEYGGGTVMLWDRGTWTCESDPRASYDAGRIKFDLEGERLRGRWNLIRTKPRGSSRQTHWLLFKERDEHAQPGVGAEAFTTSVATGRTMEEIAAGARTKKKATKKAARTSGVKAAKKKTSSRARVAAMPKEFRPQLATPATVPPDGDEWAHEVKFDGYRILAFHEGGKTRLVTRNGHDWTARYPGVAKAVAARVRVDALLDGEVVVFDRRGVSDFQALQNAMKEKRSGPVVYMAFDLPWCDGEDLTRLPLLERKARLRALIGGAQDGHIRYSEHSVGHGAAAFAEACQHGLEGIVSKKTDAPYVQQRTTSWLKIKCINRQEFVIGGFTAPAGERERFGALLVGYYDRGALRYAGRVGTGYTGKLLHSLGDELEARAQKKSPFEKPPPERDVTWVRPDLVCEVEFREWTEEGLLRQPVFVALREDRKPSEVRREPEAAPADAPSRKPARKKAAKKSASKKKSARTPAAPGARLTSPDRVVYPDRGAGYEVTKREVAAYYEAVADHILPGVVNRALAVVRCPAGEGGQCFFQKHTAKGMPDAVHAMALKNDDGEDEEILYIKDLAGLLGLVQMNALELHPWGSRLDRPDRPDRLIFDLDPGPGVPFADVVRAAKTVGDALREAGLTPFVRTTGGKGLHVVAPIQRRATWDEAKTFAKAFADTLARLAPRKFVAVASKARREGRIYMDYLRNARGATAVASYSLRIKPGAPVATPLAWGELDVKLEPAAFNIHSVPRRLAGLKRDPWDGFEDAAAPLPR